MLEDFLIRHPVSVELVYYFGTEAVPVEVRGEESVQEPFVKLFKGLESVAAEFDFLAIRIVVIIVVI